MRTQKLNQLFEAAQRVAPPAASASLAEEVVRALRQEPPDARTVPASLFEELNARFPRLAFLTLVVLALGVTVNLTLGTTDTTDLDADVAQISAPWWLSSGGF